MTSTAPRAAHDRLLIGLAILAVGLCIASAVADWLRLLPDGATVLLVIGGVTVTVRVLLLVRARRSSALSNPRVLNVVSLAGLGLSSVAAIVTLALTLSHEPLTDFLLDAAAHLWSLALLLALAVPARTLGWRPLLGVGLCGFLAVAAMAREVGTPVVQLLGSDAPLAVSVWVPLTEEVTKALPVLLVALLALRSRTSRPSAVDITLLGAASGTGFALIENAEYGRVDADWFGTGPLSMVFPSMFRSDDSLVAMSSGVEQSVAGHAVWTALVGMGIGFGVLSARRFRFAWIAIPAMLLIAVVEHGIANADTPPAVLCDLTCGGLLSPALLLIGLVSLAWYEHRPMRTLRDLLGGVLLEPSATSAHRSALAARQRPTAQPEAAPEPIGASR